MIIKINIAIVIFKHISQYDQHLNFVMKYMTLPNNIRDF